jgi:predicted nucleotidyltransferase
MVTQEIKDIIGRFVKAVAAHGIHVEHAILYGSFATGKEGKDSDLDVAVISSDFGKDRYRKEPC